MKNKTVLLVNPWIADFAAYDLWAKPLGLLYIGAFLRKYGYDISLLDFLDRHKWSEKKIEGRGKYRRTIIEKPAVLKFVKRNFALYGATENQIVSCLRSIEHPAAILVTSYMNYWYIGIQRSISLLRKHFPDTPVIMGGVYATLWKTHARQHIDADYFVSGYGEKKVLRILDACHHIDRKYEKIPEFDDTLFPAYDLYEKLDYLPLMISRGCPMNCSFCATKLLNPEFHQRSVDNILAEIQHNLKNYGVTKYAFYDDALFVKKEKVIKPLLRGIIKMPQKFEFYSPNGLFAREIDEELACLMFAAGFRVIRLGLESSITKWQAASSNKVSKEEFIKALENLEKAGYKKGDIEAYLIMGLPGQSFEDVRESLLFVHENGAISRLTAYTPIPGTLEWDRAVSMGLIKDNIDPLLTNNSIYPCASELLTINQFQELKIIMNELNDKVRKQE